MSGCKTKFHVFHKFTNITQTQTFALFAFQCILSFSLSSATLVFFNFPTKYFIGTKNILYACVCIKR